MESAEIRKDAISLNVKMKEVIMSAITTDVSRDEAPILNKTWMEIGRAHV